ncbi:opsin-5-like [Chelonoidis abingdonii]|uniref:opsin-5-like n=1 Tax=Chelonoidis abingdonii TaxID=106734 RepID=UPI0013F25801|nr:opsin-5-like [Chelonoidis abingdonii]
MDSSSLLHSDKSGFAVSEDWETIIGVYLLTLGWLSWLGNGGVIFIMYNQRHSLDPQDYLTFNLAVSDASISLFGYSRGILELFNVLRDDGFLITSVWTCKVDGFIILFFGLISINTLTAISVLRYIKGCQPHQAHKIDRKNITLTMIVIWATALFWASAPLLEWGSYTDHKYGTCEIDWIKATFSVVYKSYVIGVFISGFFIPVSIMVFCYMSIIKTVKSSHKTTRGKKISQRQRLMERNITQVSFVICFAFFLAWSPYAVISMWSACGFQVPELTNVLASLFAKSASFYNPLIYMGMSSKFRKDIRNLFQCLNQDKDSALQMPVQMFNQRNKAAVLLKPQREFVSKVPEAETPGLDMDSLPRDNPLAQENPSFCSPVSNQLTAFGVKTIQRKQSGSG